MHDTAVGMRSVPSQAGGRLEVLRYFQDGDFVFLHARRFPDDGGAPLITMELIRDTCPENTVSRRFVGARPYKVLNPDSSMVGGESSVADHGATNLNKAIVRQFVSDVFIEERLERAPLYLDMASFVSHNPRINPDAASFIELIRAEIGHEQSWSYPAIQQLVGEGNFVAVFGPVRFRGRMYAACDLFRLEDGLIVEHWDIAEPMDEYKA